VLNQDDEGIGFEILDKACTDYGLHHTARLRYNALDDVFSLLQAVSHFYFHLRRSSKRRFLTHRLNVECFEVRSSSHMCHNLNSDGLITVVAGTPDNEGSVPAYGFRITNASQIPLFVAVYFFNASDLSIS
jgi:hypothetical protein